MSSTFLESLAKQRKQFLEGLDANDGDINLDIFEDFYPDQAHFVFELLQNAEDAEATRAHFEVTQDGCGFEHDGKRLFTENNVRAITGIHNSTKKKSPDQIGKFGIGFKSVFVYTLSPEVHSGGFSFRITRLVLPEPIDAHPELGTRTRFWLPFNNPDKPPEVAFSEVEAALLALPETSILFLSHLEEISWQIGPAVRGRVRRHSHSASHVEVIKELEGKSKSSSHFLRFQEQVPGLDRQYVAVAYPLECESNVDTGDGDIPLKKRFRIISAKPGRTAVYFPADKENSGLRFHLHGPFVPELSRASIKETAVNLPLFEQLGRLAATSLHSIRDQGLLTAEFLAVLPNPHDQIPPRYECIRADIIKEMNSQPLTPTHAKSYAAANCLFQAKASLKELLSKEDLKFLAEPSNDDPQWAVGVTQKSSNVDRFLNGLDITEWDVDKFVELLIDKATDGWHWVSSSNRSASGPDHGFMQWLSAKSPEWHQELYSLLSLECQQGAEFDGHPLATKLQSLRIVRLTDSSYGVGRKCFFLSNGDTTNDVFSCVDSSVYTSGKSKTKQHHARRFLEEIGVRIIGESEQVDAILKERYTYEAEVPDEKTYRKDLKRFVALVEKQPDAASLFKESYIFLCDDDIWYQPSGAYLDMPFLDTGLTHYYKAIGTDADRAALNECYSGYGIAISRLAKFAQALGAQTQLEIVEASCVDNPEWSYLCSVPGERRTSPINRDYCIPCIRQLLKRPTIAISKLIWQTMITLPSPDYLTAMYQRNQSSGAHYAASQLVHELKVAEWVPQSSGRFVRPSEASRDFLPEGFPFDGGWKWLKAIQFGQGEAIRTKEQQQTQIAAKELGFADLETLDRARRFVALPQDEQLRILAALQRERDRFGLPTNEPVNPERRAAKIRSRAAEAPKRNTEQRERSVSVGVDDVKRKAAQYLRQQYKNEDEEMICQICKAPLPFKLADGTAYFEKVEFLPELTKHYVQNYLALCPNHAAMFQHVNGSSDLIGDVIDLTGQEVHVMLAKEHATIYFTKTHLFDVKTLIDVDRDQKRTKL